jgi:hypothetical protein
LASGRPRRSTRTTIDYANPDAGTVIAEVEDEEPGGLNIVKGMLFKSKINKLYLSV